MNQTKKQFGLVGYPIQHSKSPQMHNESFQLLNLNHQYSLYSMGPTEFQNLFPLLLKKPIAGLNVTMPYKNAVIPYLYSIDEESSLAESVNTIVLKNNHYYGYSTDGAGFFRSLYYKKPAIPLDHITIMGCGGAARSILAHAFTQKLPIKKIDVFQRYGPNFQNSFRFINKLQEISDSKIQIQLHPWDQNCALQVAISNSNLLINCTSIGYSDEQSPLVNEDFLHSGLHVYDIIYKSLDSTLIKQAKNKGCSYQTGIGMLLFQGAESFQIFTEKAMPIEQLTSIRLNEI